MAQLKLKFRTVYSFSTLFIFLLFFFISVLPNVSLAEETPYMLKLMNALTPIASNWSNKTHVCNWSGVVCDADTYRTVTIIDLSAISLTGILPSGLNDSLAFLTKLDLSNNSLLGPLPSLANLEKLQEVYLGENNFTSIPDGCFQGLIGLRTLSLRNNVNLAPWEFPIDLTPSPTLKLLELAATNLMGSLPDIFKSFPNLLGVSLSNNNLSGVLPKSSARSKINDLWLHDQISYNKMSGTIEILSSMTNQAK